jgi:phosphatidylinositol glycan class O
LRASPSLIAAHTGMARLALSVVAWVAFAHLAGLYLFTRGFLLTRLALPDASTCLPQPETPCTLPARHARVVLLIIDALRFDFISPDPPTPESAHHHRVLTLPAELTASSPENSVIFDAYADPPTTTLQRIKGLVTGSLPTFIDMGSNFGGASIEEDSLVKQLLLANKKLSIYPSCSEPP